MPHVCAHRRMCACICVEHVKVDGCSGQEPSPVGLVCLLSKSSVDASVRVCVRARACVRVRLRALVYARMHAHAYASTHAQKHGRTHARKDTRTHAQA